MKPVRSAGKASIVAVPPEQRQAIEDVIMEAFLAGTDDNFDTLLEASIVAPPVASVHTLTALPSVSSPVRQDW